MTSILLVDDDEKIREIFSRFLESRGYQVRTARHGREAVELVRQQVFQLIIMDVRMPDLNGLAAFHEIRRNHADTPIVLMTGYSAREDLQHLLQDGEVECLHKPVLMKDLDAVAHRLTTIP